MLSPKALVAAHGFATMPIRVESSQTLRQAGERILHWRDDHLTVLDGQFDGLIRMKSGGSSDRGWNPDAQVVAPVLDIKDYISH